MYELTIKFETKEELQAYLAGGVAETKKKATRRAKRTDKEAVSKDIPVEDEATKAAKAEKEAQSVAMEELSSFGQTMLEKMEHAALTAIATRVKEEKGIAANVRISTLPSDKIRDYTTSYRAAVEAHLKGAAGSKNKDIFG